jgi:starch synthase (maltosyl-transferring)
VLFPEMGRWEYGVEAWFDDFKTWRKFFRARIQGGDPDAPVEALEGLRMVRAAATRCQAMKDEKSLSVLDRVLHQQWQPAELLIEVEKDELTKVMDLYPERSHSTLSTLFKVQVERERARFSAWYEFFPRNAMGNATQHSRFRDCLSRLDDAVAMGFDIIYFPPIHPIGMTARKGKNNTLVAYADDVGSPWAIGGNAGGHRSIEQALGSEEDFVWLIAEARKRGLEIAMDFAINCSPDHPYVKDHPDWFYKRPDGSIRYAENPPKKYQDIYPLNFHCEDWKNLWKELIDVVVYWVKRGVKVFRVDNPHTKPVALWEELITTVQKYDPEVIFLSEAFTKPKMMQVLGKIGFSQSYSYFTWRENKAQLTEYVQELTQGEMRWYYRANFWPNTPDILPFYLQNANRAMFMMRAALAALLSSSWGIYSGYELLENQPLPGKEEYLDSEKFQLYQRDWNKSGNIKGFIGQLNRIRKQEEAFHKYDNIVFHHAEHDEVICFSKSTADFRSRVLVVISFNTQQRVGSRIHLNLASLNLGYEQKYQLIDLLYHQQYEWQGDNNYVELDPNATSMHVFKINSI